VLPRIFRRWRPCQAFHSGGVAEDQKTIGPFLFPAIGSKTGAGLDGGVVGHSGTGLEGSDPLQAALRSTCLTDGVLIQLEQKLPVEVVP
jgi:hypothetical protein